MKPWIPVFNDPGFFIIDNFAQLHFITRLMYSTILRIILITYLTVIVLACSDSYNKGEKSLEKKDKKINSKAASNFQDTLNINEQAAVFYFPDSLQLIEIKKSTDKSTFESLEHEYFYQIRNAKKVIKQNQPGLQILDAKNVRYIKFIRKNKTSSIIDLDTKMDTYGLFLFDGNKDPLQTDMMNVDTELWFYFKPSH